MQKQYRDISTTMNIYADVTKELKKSEFEGLDSFFKKPKNSETPPKAEG